MAERAEDSPVGRLTLQDGDGNVRHLTTIGDPPAHTAHERAILAEALELRADTLETYALTGTRHPDGDIQELGKRVRVLRREADRLRGKP